MNLRKEMVRLKMVKKRRTPLVVNKEVKFFIRAILEEKMCLEDIDELAYAYRQVTGKEFKYKLIREVINPTELKKMLDYGLGKYIDKDVIMFSYIKKDKDGEIYDVIKGRFFNKGEDELLDNTRLFVDVLINRVLIPKFRQFKCGGIYKDTREELGRTIKMLQEHDGNGKMILKYLTTGEKPDKLRLNTIETLIYRYFDREYVGKGRWNI